MWIARDYQQIALNATLAHIKNKGGNPLVVVPTGGGKSPIMGFVAKELLKEYPNLRICVLVHVKELVAQNAETIRQITDRNVAIYSAGLNQKDVCQITVGGIQSIYSKSLEVGTFDLIMIDEAHRVPESGQGMYRTFLSAQYKQNNNIRVLGVTATPFRTGGGYIYGKGKPFDSLAYEIPVKELIEKGFLCKPINQKSAVKVSLKNVRIQNGEFLESDLNNIYGNEAINYAICADMVKQAKGRKKWIVFACSIEHCEMISDCLNRLGVSANFIHSNMTGDRDQVIEDFKNDKFQAIVNCNVLTEGFDVKNISCVVLAKPTTSAGLYCQMIGRGFRIHPDKEDFLVLDYGKNISRFGAVDNIRIDTSGGKEKEPFKICSSCDFDLNPIGAKECVECGHIFRKECPKCFEMIPLDEFCCSECGHDFKQILDLEGKVDIEASNEAILTPPIDFQTVEDISYNIHENWAKGSVTLRIDYNLGLTKASEWICFEHDNYARSKAVIWWLENISKQIPCPKSVRDAQEIILNQKFSGDGIREPSHIKVDSTGKFDKIIEKGFKR